MSTEPSGITTVRALRDDAAEADLCDLGFCVLRGLGTDLVPQLVDLHGQVHPSTEAGFVSDVDGADPPRKRELAELLGPYWSDLLDASLVDHRVLVGGFLVKWPDPASLLPLHQHWTCVDEPGVRSLTVWVALDDTDADIDNGPVLVLPRSHLIADEYFGSGTSAWYEPYEDAVWEAMVPVPMSAGDVLVMDGRLVHGSGPNRSGRPRRALGGAAAPSSAQLVHALALDDRLVEVLDVPPDFLIDHVIVRTGEDGTATAAARPSRVVRRTRRPLDQELLRAVCPGADLDDGPVEQAGLPAGAAALQRARALADRAGRAVLDDDVAAGAAALGRLARADALPTIRAELGAVIGAGFRLVPEQVLDGAGLGDQLGAPGWRVLVLADRDGPLPGIADLAPETVAHLRAAGGVRRASLAALGPGDATGWQQVPADVIRIDLAVVVPRRSPACRLELDASDHTWRSGELLVHPAEAPVRAVNYADGDLVVLRVDLERPMRGAWRALSPLRRAADRSSRFDRRAREVHSALTPCGGGSHVSRG